MGKVIAVLSGKGGVGKTTVTANLGVALREIGKRVIVVDLNLTSSHLGIHFGLFYFPKTINDLLSGRCDVLSVIYRHPSGVHLLPASIDNFKEIEIAQRTLSKVFRELKKSYDFVIVDSPPGFGSVATLLVKNADKILIITNPDPSSLMDAKKLCEICHKLKKKKKCIDVIVNRVSFSGKELKIEEIENALGKKVIGVIPEDKIFKESLFFKEPVVFFKPNHWISYIFKRIASKIANSETPQIHSTFEKLKLNLKKLFDRRIYLTETYL